MEGRLLRAALWRRRGTVALAVLAVAIGSSVAAALMHVSDDVSRKVGRELRSLGPNVLVVPAPIAAGGGIGAAGRFMDEADLRARLDTARVPGALLLYASAEIDGRAIPLIGCDLRAVRALHPSWQIDARAEDSFMGADLARKLGVTPGASLTLVARGGATLTRRVAGLVETGGTEEASWWLALTDVQALVGLENRVSVAELRVEDAGTLAALTGRIEGSGLRVLPLHALSETEGELLARMQRLMLLVTIAALVAAGLAAFGTLTDLALMRRREIALMKSLGARRRDVVRQFVAESTVIGTAGGVIGWGIGVFFAFLIGRTVFHSTIAIQPGVPFIVMALALGVALLASVGPIQLALRIDAAGALKGDG